MRIKNKSAKIITVGMLDILPGKVVDLDEATASNPVIQLFLNNGFMVKIPDEMLDEVSETPEKLAAKIKKMKKSEVIDELKKQNAEFGESDTAEELKKLLLETLVD